MKLNDIEDSSPKKVNQVLESRFGLRVDFDRMTIERADRLLGMVNEGVQKVRMSPTVHTSERNPRYMELLMIKEGLENWLDRQYISEGEVETAQAILAAKDFVDRLQDMIEDASQMLNEDLPPLGDSIKDQIGANEGSAFVAAATEALNGLLEAVKVARESMDSATRVLAGQEAPSAPAGAMIAAEPVAEPVAASEPAGELPALPDLEDSDEEPVGRERR
jgi:hypothetical protein